MWYRVKGEKVQPTRVSEEEYKRFKQFVQDVHGTTRGHLSTEIENALREYRKPDNKQDKLTRIEDDMATVQAMLADAESDGGTATVSDNSANTHAHADSKPEANAPRSEKVEWVISENYSRGDGSEVRSRIKGAVVDEFGFGDRTADEYVELIINELDAKCHPNNQDLFVWGDEIERVKQNIRENAQNTASERMSEITDE